MFTGSCRKGEWEIFTYALVLHHKILPQKDLASPSNKGIWICELA